jgi:cell wall assembly regulator SMI1
MKNTTILARDLIKALAKLDPPMNPMFRGPASKEAIQQAQIRLGVALEPDLIEFLMCIDGQEPDGWGFLGDPIVPQFRFGPEPEHFSGWGWLRGIEQIVELTLWYRDMAKENEDEVYECHGPACFHGNYLQLISSENPTSIAIDSSPLPGGVVGQIVAINDQPNHIVVLAPNFREFLQSVVDGYENGRFKYRDGVWSEP